MDPKKDNEDRYPHELENEELQEETDSEIDEDMDFPNGIDWGDD